MQPGNFLEFLDAAHLSKYVESPYHQRGGIMIVGPPNTLKSTFIEKAFGEYPNSLILSDINVNTLTQIKDDLAAGHYPTIAFPAFEKLYQRHKSTSANVEGYLMALVEEGYSRASFEDQRMAAIKARALIVGAIPYSFYQSNYTRWNQSGFLRRFLWCVLRLKDSEKIMDAIHNWKLIPFNGVSHRIPGSKSISYSLSAQESRSLRAMIREQPSGNSTPYVLLKKIHCALKWKYSGTSHPTLYKKIMDDVSPAFGKEGAIVEL
jgi:hypothetical protein